MSILGSGASNNKDEFLGDVHAASFSTSGTITVGRLGTGEWRAYTPTVIGTSGVALAGTVTQVGRFKIVGKTCSVNVRINSTGVGTAGVGTYRITLPRGVTPDTNTFSPCGVAFIRANANTALGYCIPDTLGLSLVTATSEAGSVSGTLITVNATNYDAASTNGVGYELTASFEIL